MSNHLINKLAIMQSGNNGAGMTTVKFLHLLFLSSLAGLFSLSVNATELTETASKLDSGFYDGSFGKGAYWVTKGLYSSIFSAGGKNVIDTDAPNSNTNKLPDLIRDEADKPVKYFIYSYNSFERTSDLSRITDNVIRAENELINQKLRLPRKIQVRVSRVKQSNSIIQA